MAGFIGSPAMNFVTAELVRDDGAAVAFACYSWPVSAEVLKAKPGPADYFGQKVIPGHPPPDFGDAVVNHRGWGTMNATAGVTEKLGREIMVIFTTDAPHVEHASLAQAAEDEDEAAEDEDEAAEDEDEAAEDEDEAAE
ncbi:MAG: ABC transporter ATP-binding protein, partial [Actinobacteria bacterium]|nr:ABC transporter ATP-binding protein [Actinomycetota bacterium]